MKTSCALMIALFCGAANFLPAQDLGNQPADVQPSTETIVYPIREGLPRDLASLLMELYPDSQIAAIQEHNVLLIRAAAASRDELMGVLTKLDRPKQTLVLHAYLLRSHGSPLSVEETAGLSGSRDEVLGRIADLQKRDQLSIENRIEITTIEDQEAMVQIGKQIPVVSGTSITSSRGRTNSYRQIATGTILSVKARTTPDDLIVMEINFEKSDVDYPAASTEDAAATPAEVSTLTHQTTVQFADGHAVLAGTLVGKPVASSGHSYLVVTASIRNGSATPRSVAQRVKESIQAGGILSRRESRFPAAAPRISGQSPSERFDALARALFDEADRDGNGLLSGEELDKRGVGIHAADSVRRKGISFADYMKLLVEQRRVKRPAEADVEPAAKAGENSIQARVLAYATKVLSKYDTDGDGKLDAMECGKMSKDPFDADADKDGFVNALELAQWYSKR